MAFDESIPKAGLPGPPSSDVRRRLRAVAAPETTGKADSEEDDEEDDDDDDDSVSPVDAPHVTREDDVMAGWDANVCVRACVSVSDADTQVFAVAAFKDQPTRWSACVGCTSRTRAAVCCRSSCVCVSVDCVKKWCDLHRGRTMRALECSVVRHGPMCHGLGSAADFLSAHRQSMILGVCGRATVVHGACVGQCSSQG
jgi:hypothetical protein